MPMRSLIISCLLLISSAAMAMSPEYDSSRQWVEQHNPKDTTPASARVFVVFSTNSVILRFRDGIALREIIDATPLKGKAGSVYVLRESQKKEPVYDSVVPPADKPPFLVKPRDLIFIYVADGTPRW